MLSSPNRSVNFTWSPRCARLSFSPIRYLYVSTEIGELLSCFPILGAVCPTAIIHLGRPSTLGEHLEA